MRRFKFLSEDEHTESIPVLVDYELTPLSYLAGNSVDAIRELDNQIQELTEQIERNLRPNSEVNQ